MRWYAGLKHDVSLLISAPCTSCNLSEKLKSSLAGSEIRDMKSHVTVNDSYIGNVRKIVPLGNHLSADEDVDLTFSNEREYRSIVLQ
jgi:hypothetical protein